MFVWMTPDDGPELTAVTYRKVGSDTWRIKNTATGAAATVTRSELIDLLPDAGTEGAGEIWGCEADYIFGRKAATA